MWSCQPLCPSNCLLEPFVLFICVNRDTYRQDKPTVFGLLEFWDLLWWTVVCWCLCIDHSCTRNGQCMWVILLNQWINRNPAVYLQERYYALSRYMHDVFSTSSHQSHTQNLAVCALNLSSCGLTLSLHLLPPFPRLSQVMGLIPHVSSYISNLFPRVLNYGWYLPDKAPSYISLPPSSHLDPSGFIILCEDHLAVSKPCPATWELTLIFIRKAFWREEITGEKRE